jgi:hypothetical protein
VTSEDVDLPRRSLQLADALDILATLIAASLLVLSAVGEAGLPRLLLALGFAFFVPGRAIVTNWPRMAEWSEVAMPIVLSLALLTLLAMLSLWARLWRPVDVFQVEAFLSLGGLGVGVVQRSRNRAVHPLRQLNSRSRRRRWRRR